MARFIMKLPIYSISIVLAAVTATIVLLPQAAPNRRDIERGWQELRTQLIPGSNEKSISQARADAAIYEKAVDWALRYDMQLTDADLRLLQKMIDRGRKRCSDVSGGSSPWDTKRGRLVRGYVSDVD